MAKKYLTLEEAAVELGISQDKLKRAREDGDIRGFADRGNWKFRQEDLEEFGRSLQADSSPDVPLFGAGPNFDDEGASDSGVRMLLDSAFTGSDDSSDESIELEGGSNVEIPISFGDSSAEIQLDGDSSSEIPLSLGDSDNEFGLNLADEDSSEEMPLVLDDSDSDVKLVTDLDDESLADSSSEVLLTGRESDSDVRLLDQTVPMVMDGNSDSDVRLIKTDSDSDVKLVGSNSDSDVRLLSPGLAPEGDSDVSLSGRNTGDTEIAINLGRYEDDETIESVLSADDGSDITLSNDSGIALDIADDSGIALDTSDSDISLAIDDDDEGLTLETASDSGISLDMPADSGISLDMPADSGISLAGSKKAASVPSKGSAKSPPKQQVKKGGSTKSGHDDSNAETMVGIPALGDDDDDESDFELGALEGDSSSDTSVLLFDDEDDADDRAATMIKKKRGDSEETFDLDAGEAFDEEFDDDDELLGEDDEIEDFVDDEDFMAEDGDFDDNLGAGESQADFVAPTGASYGPAEEQEWGGLMFGAVLLGSFAMVACALVMFDLVRFMWASGDAYNQGVGPLIDMVGIK